MVELLDPDTSTPEDKEPSKKNNLILESVEDFNRMIGIFFQYLREIDKEARALQESMDHPQSHTHRPEK